jgi:hypothetical protein
LEILTEGKGLTSAVNDTYIKINSRNSDCIINGHALIKLFDWYQMLNGFVWALAFVLVPLYPGFSEKRLILTLIVIHVGMSIFAIFFEIYYAGITSIIMCFSQNPSRVGATKPEIYDVIKELFPQAVAEEV